MPQPSNEQIIEFVNKSALKIGPKIWKLFQDEFNTHLTEPLSVENTPLIASSFITLLFMWGINDYCHFTKTTMTAGWLDKFLVNTMRVVKDHLLPKRH